MSSFAAYTLAGILHSVGWPRKSGFLGRKVVVNIAVVDQAVKQLLKIGVGLGAGRPKVALRLIADSFDRDWSASSVAELLDFLSADQRVSASAEQAPWRAIAGPGFASVGRETVPWQWLEQPEMALHYCGWFAQALLWGILHTSEAKAALEADRDDYNKWAGLGRQHGLSVSAKCPWATNEDFYAHCEELVNNFQTERRSLAEIPAALLNEPRFAGLFGDETLMKHTGSPSPACAWSDFFDDVLKGGRSRLAEGSLEDVFRASLAGGCQAALAVLRQDGQLLGLWGEGSLEKAERLAEVWASSIALVLLQNAPDHDSVCRGVSEGFASVVFTSDTAQAYQELRAFQLQQQADEKMREEGGIPTYAYTLLRLRCLRALGRDLNLGALPIPVRSSFQVIDMNIVDAKDWGDLEEALLFQHAYVTGAMAAKEVLGELRRNSQTAPDHQGQAGG